METVFIYALNDPVTGRTRYIGKTKKPSDRISQHVSESRKRPHHRACWIRSLVNAGLRPTLEVLDKVPDAEWGFWEMQYIRLYRALGFDLVNASDGGEGGNTWQGRHHTEETKARMSAAALAHERTPEHQKALRKAARKPKSLETRAKISAAKTGTKLSPERCAEISIATSGVRNPNFGKTHSPETREKIRLKATGRKRSAESRANQSNTWKLKRLQKEGA